MKMHFYSLILMLALSAGCAPAPSGPTPDLVSTVVAATLTAQPAFTPIPTSTAPPPTAADIEESTTTYYVSTSSENVNLRTGPGTVFKVSRVMPQGTRLQVSGHAPGGEWLSVINPEAIPGWVQVNFVTGGGYDGLPVPVVEPQGAHLISGRVLDGSGLPVNGIGFAISRGTAPNAPRTDAFTDETGTFYAYLPQTVSGVWDVTYISIACTSSMMDAECNCKGGACGRPQPDALQVTLPVEGVLNFIWR